MSLKTRSSAKKRFKISGTGKIMCKSGCRRHGLTQRSKKMRRQTRGNRTTSTMENSIIRRILGNCKSLKLNNS